ncbi:MAG: putative Ig domain-containing protein [Gallionella sp.]
MTHSAADPMQQDPMRYLRSFAITMMLVFGIAACGGGGGGGGGGTPAPTAVAVITAQPTDRSVMAGSTATFNVVATGATGYQWQHSTDGGANFTNVSGATAASYTTPATFLTDSGRKYRVVVSGAGNSVTSSAVKLTVTSAVVAPGISVQPTDTRVTAPDTASFSVTATGTSISYQWQLCMDTSVTCLTWSNIPGATSATYSTSATDTTMSGRRYRVGVSNSLGTLQSASVTLLVDPTPDIPAITSQPGDVTVVVGSTASFTVAFAGVPTPTPNWFYSDDGSNWFDLPYSGATYTTGPTSLSDNGRQFFATVANAAGTATSNTVTLTVNDVAVAPSFTTQPAAVSITEGQDAQFTVAVSGTPTPALQWEFSIDNGANWSNINGATSTVLNVAGAALADNANQYRAVASNGAGSATSVSALLSVAASIVITTSSLPDGVNGNPYTATLASSGGTGTHTWTIISGPLPVGLNLDSATGVISGTPQVPVSLTATTFPIVIQVDDSSNPILSAQKSLSILINNPFGALAVANAPANTLEAIFCPQSDFPPSPPPGQVTVTWQDPGVAPDFESIAVVFDSVSGVVDSVDFTLSTSPQRTWSCDSSILTTVPDCSGVTVNIVNMNGTVSFTNTVLEENATSNQITLDGLLTY